MDSEQYETVVRRHHVRRREIQVLLAAVLAAILLIVGFFLGQRIAYSGLGIDPENYRELERSQPIMVEKFETLEHQLDINDARNEVDRTALEMVRQELAAQQEQIRTLEENLRFYQSIMSPGDVPKGLTLRPIELLATDTANRFHFRIIVRQEVRKHNLLKGELTVTVVGVDDNRHQSFSLADLSEDVEAQPLPLRFRYFQVIEGELELPQGFTPQSVSLLARSSSPSKVEVNEEFPWSVQERFSYVGK